MSFKLLIFQVTADVEGIKWDEVFLRFVTLGDKSTFRTGRKVKTNHSRFLVSENLNILTPELFFFNFSTPVCKI